MTKHILFALVIGAVIIAAAALYQPGTRSPETGGVVATIDASGKQIVDITARGGYSPRLVQAQAGRETVIRVSTKDTYDCSVSLVIPKLGYEKFLSPVGTEEIIVPAEKAKGTINGLCTMGMYSFKIVFN
jgi:Cu+-exporting ATPase